MLLAIDAGNTNVVFALVAGGEIKARWRIATDPRRTADDLSSDWLARAHPIGTPLSVHGAGAERVSGTFAGLEADGALRLQTAQGIETIRAGDVEL